MMKTSIVRLLVRIAAEMAPGEIRMFPGPPQDKNQHRKPVQPKEAMSAFVGTGAILAGARSGPRNSRKNNRNTRQVTRPLSKSRQCRPERRHWRTGCPATWTRTQSPRTPSPSRIAAAATFHNVPLAANCSARAWRLAKVRRPIPISASSAAAAATAGERQDRPTGRAPPKQSRPADKVAPPDQPGPRDRRRAPSGFPRTHCELAQPPAPLE